MKNVTSFAVAVVLGVLGLGVGVFFWTVAETWTEANTAATITAMAMICGGGALVMATILAALVGIPLARRLSMENAAPYIDVRPVGRTDRRALPPPPDYGFQPPVQVYQNGVPTPGWGQPGNAPAVNGYGQFVQQPGPGWNNLDTSQTQYNWWQE